MATREDVDRLNDDTFATLSEHGRRLAAALDGSTGYNVKLGAEIQKQAKAVTFFSAEMRKTQAQADKNATEASPDELLAHAEELLARQSRERLGPVLKRLVARLKAK